MNRRTFLGTLSAVGGLGLGGCVNRTSHEEGASPEPRPLSSVGRQTDQLGTRTDDRRVTLIPDEQQWTVTKYDKTSESLGFSLRNRSSRPFVTDQGAWTIERRTDDGWQTSATGDQSDQSITVAPGTTHTWSLGLVPHSTPLTSKTTYIWADLSNGTHTLDISGELQGGDRSHRINRVAQFELIFIVR